MRYADLNEDGTVTWRFSNHSIFVYYMFNTLQRINVVQNVSMRMDVIKNTPEEMLSMMKDPTQHHKVKKMVNATGCFVKR